MSEITCRLAKREDLDGIIRMLADDSLGSTREQYTSPLPKCYVDAFEAIDADPNSELLVAARGDEVIAMLQLTFTPGLSHQGSWRATIESVRTAATLRGQGIGTRMMNWAIERARARGCRIVQLSTHKTRIDAQRFYERLGFVATHNGMKLWLE